MKLRKTIKISKAAHRRTVGEQAMLTAIFCLSMYAALHTIRLSDINDNILILPEDFIELNRNIECLLNTLFNQGSSRANSWCGLKRDCVCIAADVLSTVAD